MKTVSVLFARSDSIYKQIPACDVFDLERNAMTYSGTSPVVAHPPCRGWGRLRHLAKIRDGELDTGHFAVEQVRRCGGVLEHPASSLLWSAAGLPAPGKRDSFGGFTVPILQSWFGHPCPKNTWLYVVGVEPGNIPDLPFKLGIPAGRVQNQTRAAREKTPPDLALWLVALAGSVSTLRASNT